MALATGMNRVWGVAHTTRGGSTAAPLCTITVYKAGTVTPVTLYSDAAGTTPLANPFTSAADGYFDFYTPQPGRIDIAFSGTGIGTPYTLGDVEGQPVLPSTATFNVQFYGAVGDGVTNDTVAVQAAITAAIANLGGVVYFPPGTYRLVGQLSAFGANNVQFIGDDYATTILSWDDTATKGLWIDMSSTANVSSLLTVDGAVGDRTISVAAGGTFTVGQFVYLKDTGTNTGSLISRVRQIAANDVTLDEALPCDLFTANTAAMTMYTQPFVTGVVVRGLTFQCSQGNATASKLTLLELSHTFGHLVENCMFNGSTGPLITHQSCRSGVIRNTILQNALTIAGTGIETQTSTAMIVTGNFIWDCQFGLTFASSPFALVEHNEVTGRQITVALGRGIRFGESSNFGKCVGNTITDPNLFGVYSQDSAFVVISANTISFTGSGTNPNEHGIQIGGFEQAFCHHCTVEHNIIRGTSGYGISVAPTGAAGAQLFTVISGNNCSNCAQGGVLLFRVSRNTVIGNIFSAPGSTVITAIVRVDSTSAGYNAIVGNIIRNEDSTATLAISTSTGTGGHNVISANIYDDSVGALTTSFAATDTYGVPQPQHPLINTTRVATGADVLETTAWDITVLGNTFDSINQGWRLIAEMSLGADANNKTVTVYVGDKSVSGTTNENNKGLILDVRGYYVNSNGHMEFFVEMRISGTSTTPIFKYAGDTTTNAAPWTADQHIKVTMTNGSAVANDVIFQCGMFTWIGVPAAAYDLQN